MTCKQCNSHISDDKIGQSPRNNLDLLDSAESSAPATLAVDSDVAFTIESMSTKIKALMADLYKHNTTEKRSLSTSTLSYLFKWLTIASVVFSYRPTRLILFN